MAEITKSIDELVGHTPIFEPVKYEKKNNLAGKLLVKLEWFNITGSIKARAAIHIQDAIDGVAPFHNVPERFTTPFMLHSDDYFNEIIDVSSVEAGKTAKELLRTDGLFLGWYASDCPAFGHREKPVAEHPAFHQYGNDKQRICHNPVFSSDPASGNSVDSDWLSR